ncbi:MAG: CHASE2 domain-containing protein [Rhodospirillaceae bacterium]|nr:CHASE2 domain-containing protein [Rhodospirillaceae bacterium]MBT4690427.1 CHASE2 domain-containing protein [Rhodospirillaceae bacterium]MBT5083952.1 CHASE2 domain-containing protein [Rhodospirillaceae bacterium]MBT5525462.1 CHASE2 domain-containing protein [Rhodospirillaceae bacterium]MBT6983874.1 CHASE2 domain-containing protein [Rhodospirillaceae bacterium]
MNGEWTAQRWPALILLLLFLPQPWLLPSLWPGISNSVFDSYQRISPRKIERLPVAIVDIDEASLKAIGQWPWPRTELARLVEGVAAAGALAVGLDILMPEADRFNPAQLVARYPNLEPTVRDHLTSLPGNDDLFAMTLFPLPVVIGQAGLNDTDASALGSPPPALTTVKLKGRPPHDKLLGFTRHLGNVPTIEAAGQGHGFLNSQPGPNGIVRSVPAVVQVAGGIYPTLSTEVLRLALGQKHVILEANDNGAVGLHIGRSYLPLDPDGTVRLHFSHADSRRRVSALDLLQGKLDKNIFADQVVLIGATALGLRDAPPTPLSFRMDGIEIQAQMIETQLAGTRLMRPSWMSGVEAVLLLLLGGMLVLAGRDAPPWRLAILFLVPGAVALVLGVTMFIQGRLLLDPTSGLLGSGLICAFLLTTGYAQANRRKRALDEALALARLETARMAGELGAAREIQLGILPDPKAIAGQPDSLDFHALLEPAREVGGDLYDAFMVDETRFFFLIGDVSGKGVGASLFMALSKALCKSAALRGDVNLGEMVNVASSEIARENPAVMFVTAVAGLLDTATGILQFCNAGHDAPILLGSDNVVRNLHSKGGPPFCVLEGFPYPVEEVQLSPGDAVVLFTDGVSEAQGSDTMQFGMDRIHEHLVQCNPDLDAEAICTGLQSAVNDFIRGAPAYDDVAIMALRWVRAS